jgi:hypothetical protein
MGINPMYQGQTGPDWTPTVTIDSGAPAPLVGATNFVLRIKEINGQIDRTGGGAVTVNNGALGQITYPWGANDTAIVGHFTLQFQWTTAAGKTQFSDPFPWEVKPV